MGLRLTHNAPGARFHPLSVHLKESRDGSSEAENFERSRQTAEGNCLQQSSPQRTSLRFSSFFPICLTALGFLAFGHDKGESGKSHSWEEPCVCMVNRESHGAKAVVRQSRGRGGGWKREGKEERE